MSNVNDRAIDSVGSLPVFEEDVHITALTMVLTERKAMAENLTATQTRASQLIQSERAAKKLLRELLENIGQGIDLSVHEDRRCTSVWLTEFTSRVREYLK